jgi:hypothetical protein
MTTATATAPATAATVWVYAHDSGQRYNWAFSPEAVERDRDQWFEDAKRYNNMPLECIGKIQVVDLKEINDGDCYVG